MNILSLFDGMSCGQIAAERSFLKVDKYYASEIDKSAVKVSSHNYPNTIHLGCVKKVKASELDFIDLLIGGSPCQGFSRAGDGLAFDDPRSVLFFEFLRILQEIRIINPEVKFLLENVEMGKKNEMVITRLLGVKPIRLCSSIVSAQSRPRLYWTNISVNTIPKNTRTFLNDILESDVDPKHIQSESWHQWWSKNFEKQIKKGYSTVDADKTGCLTARMYSSWNGNFIRVPEATKKGYAEINPGECVDLTFPNIKTRRGRKMSKKSNALTASKFDYRYYNGETLRRLTVNECCRLQTVPDNYFKDIVSDNQAYKMLGNGWTVDIIAHIFSHLPSKFKKQ